MSEKQVPKEDEQRTTILLYRKIKRAVDKGKDVTIKRKRDGEMCVYETEMKLAD